MTTKEGVGGRVANPEVGVLLRLLLNVSRVAIDLQSEMSTEVREGAGELLW
jgi:hypothetical protein